MNYATCAAGNYNVVMPEVARAGKYKIRVGLFGDDSVYACSPAFEVLPVGDGLWTR